MVAIEESVIGKGIEEINLSDIKGSDDSALELCETYYNDSSTQAYTSTGTTHFQTDLIEKTQNSAETVTIPAVALEKPPKLLDLGPIIYYDGSIIDYLGQVQNQGNVQKYENIKNVIKLSNLF